MIEQLEMQKLTLEQQHIEQNYLGANHPYHIGHALMQNKSTEKGKENQRVSGMNNNKSRKNKGINDHSGPSDENLDLSPIGRNSRSPKNIGSSQKKNLLSELNGLSHPGPLSNQALINRWNYFSPSASILLPEEAQKSKERGSNMKEKSLERGNDGPKGEVSYFNHYQKKQAQRTTTTNQNNSISSTTMDGLGQRKRSLPQAYNNNPNEKKQHVHGVLSQHTTPKEADHFFSGPNLFQMKDLHAGSKSTKNQIKKGVKSSLNASNKVGKNSFSKDVRSPGSNMRLDDQFNGFSSPKMLNLNINSLNSQNKKGHGAPVNQGLRSTTVEQTKNRNSILQNAYFPEERYKGTSSFVEPRNQQRESQTETYPESNGRLRKQRKSLSVETSIHLDDKRPENGMEMRYLDDDYADSRNNVVTEGNELATRRIYHNLHGMMDMMRKSQNGDEEFMESAGGRSRSTGTAPHAGRFNSRPNSNYLSQKASHREHRVEESNYMHIDDLDMRAPNNLNYLASPVGRRGKDSFQDGMYNLKAKTISHDQNIQDVMFFDAVR